MMRFKIILLLCLLFHSALGLAKEADSPAIIAYQYAIYLDSHCTTNSDKEVQGVLSGALKNKFTLVESFDTYPVTPVLNIKLNKNVQKSYAPPSAESIKLFGKGLSQNDATKLQAINTAIIINVAYPEKYIFSGMLDALNFTEQLAIKCNGFIWDEETREIFTPQIWHDLRISSWSDGVPDVSEHTIIHVYKNTEYNRGITLGMVKFLKPDVVVNDFSWSDSKSVGSLINLVTQSMVEGEELADDWSIELNIKKIKNSLVSAHFSDLTFENAQQSMKVRFNPAKPEEGDPNNFLLEVDFSGFQGDSLQEKQDALLSELFGWKDQISYVKHNQNIDAASELARQKLPNLKDKFLNGLVAGEYIHVKAPFKTMDGGNEWMWVEVVKWGGIEIEGLLQNMPFNVPNLKTGSKVIVDESKVFDYIYYKNNGTSEGNTTGKLIQQYQVSQQEAY